MRVLNHIDLTSDNKVKYSIWLQNYEVTCFKIATAASTCTTMSNYTSKICAKKTYG